MIDTNDERPVGAAGPLYPAEAARGGEIILTTRRRRIVFIGGLIVTGFLAVSLAIFAPA